jgi:hypothetical protein
VDKILLRPSLIHVSNNPRKRKNSEMKKATARSAFSSMKPGSVGAEGQENKENIANGKNGTEEEMELV